MFALRCVPPSPEVMAILFMEYRRSGKMKTMSFKKYLKSIGFTDPAAEIVGMDDAARFRRGPAGPELIEIPSHPVKGKLQVKVLLVDFPDRQGALPPQHYEDMLFSNGKYPTGSMRDFYKEVSLSKVDVVGSVHGWLRMPNPYSYYTNNESGMKGASYPHNAQRMAEDAVNAALQKGIGFGQDLDKLNQGIVTALFIIHAGRGAEQLHPSVAGKEIWSHKWNLKNSVDVGNGLSATIYLTVPHDCKVGVCAHELGHLAFQWQDFYDPNYDDDGQEWDGSGVWDLMAGGSWNGDGARPAHPAGLHKIQHGWVPITTVAKSRSLTLKPYTAKSGRVYKIVSLSYGAKQYLILENRKRSGFDFNLPGEGLLIWRVDEKGEMEAPDRPGLLLIQADGKHDLEQPKDWNEGDGGDPFPGKARRKMLKDTGSISTSFPNGKRSGVTLENIVLDQASGKITLDVKFAAGNPG
ncbi:MAG: M6 family metalloprotease domain-containing protein [Deltaproteobacteria bacterium]|nr:M6 family metalloprotease domain-containing protein [Deltaproteobacteria bacterium]